VVDLVAADPDGGPRLLIDTSRLQTLVASLWTAAESAIDRTCMRRAQPRAFNKRAKYAVRFPDYPHHSCNREPRFGGLWEAPFSNLLLCMYARRATTS
jgi:hypothetical protein